MAFYCRRKLYGNRNLGLLGEVTENNNPTVISRETKARAVVFCLFIWMFFLCDLGVSAVSGRGESRCLCRLQSCDFLSCASQATGLTQWEASKYSCREYRRLGHFSFSSHPAAWINVAFERLPECDCLIMKVWRSRPCWSCRCVWYGSVCVCVNVCGYICAVHYCIWGLRSGSGVK